MFGILARLLEILYSVWPSYGGSIVLFTVVVMLALAPLTFKSTRSMLAMQALQPEMKKLQNRYKDDRQKLNEEMMKFYQENKISPLGGCLPMLIQLPVFFILYAVLLGLTKRGPFGADLGHSVACSIGGINTCVPDVGTYAHAGFFHPAYISHTSLLYENLSSTRIMYSWGLDLSQSAWGELTKGIVHALPYLIMVLVVMGLTYLQQQQIQSRQPNRADQNPTQQMMMKVMPIAMGFIYIIIPAGVVIYFLVSSLFRIGQQAMVTRTFYSGPNAVVIPTTATDSTGEPAKRKGFWDQFKPSEASLPQVGKKAKQQRAQSGASSGTKAIAESSGAGSGTKASSKPSGKSNGKSAAKSSTKAGGRSNGKPNPKSGNANSGDAATSGQQRSAAGAGSKSGSNGTKKQRNGTSSTSESGSEPQSDGAKSTTSAVADGPIEAPSRKAPSRSAPSRRAPNRKAPQGPGRGDGTD